MKNNNLTSSVLASLISGGITFDSGHCVSNNIIRSNKNHKPLRFKKFKHKRNKKRGY